MPCHFQGTEQTASASEREQSDFHKALLSIWQPVGQMVTKGGAEGTCDDNNIFHWVDTNLPQIITSIFHQSSNK